MVGILHFNNTAIVTCKILCNMIKYDIDGEEHKARHIDIVTCMVTSSFLLFVPDVVEEIKLDIKIDTRN